MPRRAVAAVLLLPLLGGCGGGSSADSLADALGQLPRVDGDLVTVTWADVDAVREANGLDDAPAPGDDGYGDYVGAMTGLDADSVVMVPLSGYDRESPASREDLGFGWTDAESTASVASGTGTELVTYVADDDLQPAEGLDDLGGDRYRFDDVFTVALDGHRAAVSREEDVVRAWQDRDDTLDDDDALTEVAEAIDDEDAVSALVTTLGSDGGLVGFGWVDDDGDQAFVIVYGLDSDDAADEARDTLAAGFDEVSDVVDVDDVRTDGSLVVVTGHQVDDVSAPFDLLQNARLPVPQD